MSTRIILALVVTIRRLNCFVRFNSDVSPSRAFYSQSLNSRFAAKDTNELISYIQTVYLPKQFGFNEFRPGQKEVIQNILSNKSCLAILPTGAGKSLCFQLPAQIMSGVTVVVSPLLALMRDQVDSLRSKGISAYRIDSSMNFEDVAETEEKLLKGLVKLIYVSPERFSNERFMKLLGKSCISLFVVDEAHCISEWGHSFRPDYLRLYEHSKKLNVKLFLALTATATSRVAQDIISNLGIPAANVVKQSSYRMNLKLHTVKLNWPNDNYEDRLLILKTYLSNLQSDGKFGATIIYVSRQKIAFQLAHDLECSSYNSRAYHAGMSTEARKDVEDWFLGSSSSSSSIFINETDCNDIESLDVDTSSSTSNVKIVVATSAFGMGIDKANVRSVVHWELPRSIEDYIQGIGRSGRDGNEANCLAMLGDVDIILLRNSIYGTTPPLAALRGFVAYILDKNTGFKVIADQNVLYVNLYEVANLFDINELSLKLGLSYLCQLAILKEKTTVFGSIKISKVNETIFQQYVDNTLIPSTVATTVEDDDDSTISSDGSSVLKDLSVTIGLYLMECSRKSPRKKWLEVDVLQLANELAQSPQRVVSALTLLVDHTVCTLGGISKPYLRYSYNGDTSATSSEEDMSVRTGSNLRHIEELLSEYFQKNEVKSLARLSEVNTLLRSSPTSSLTTTSTTTSNADTSTAASTSLWNKVIKYFDDDDKVTFSTTSVNIGAGGEGGGGKRSSSLTSSSSLMSTVSVADDIMNKIPFNETAWSQLMTTLTTEAAAGKKGKDSITSLPLQDIYCMTNFVTGVLSPKIFRLKLYQHPSYGSFAHCQWYDVYTRCKSLSAILSES